MFKGTASGIIGFSENMKPRCDSKNGNWFGRFKMFCIDESRRPEKNTDGQMRRPSIAVQVILPNNDAGKALFERLVPGRRVHVEGKQSYQPNIWKNPNTSEDQAFANPIIYLRPGDLTFLDSPPMTQVNRNLQVLVESKIIDKEISDEYKEILEKHYARTDGEAGVAKNKEEEVEDTDRPF